MGRSLKAKSISGILSLKSKETSEYRKKQLNKVLSKGEKASSPSIILKTRFVDNQYGRMFYANEESKSNITVIYIHGGAYCTNFLPFHWSFLRKIVKNTDALIIAPGYRLVPFGTYKDAFNLIIPMYQEHIKKYPNNKIILMGDSAGGGLALSLAIYFKKNKIKLPDELILFSPWVDVVLDNNEIKEYEDKDPMLSVGFLKAAVESWLGDVDDHDWHVSPLYGDLNGIHNVTSFVGTREIFYPDIRKLYHKLDKNNELIIGEDMNHAYPLIPIPESKKAFKKIVEIIKRNSH